MITIQSLAAATGYSESAVSNALFAIARMARERGCIVDEETALQGLGEVLAFAAVCAERHARTRPESDEGTTGDPQGGHEYP